MVAGFPGQGDVITRKSSQFVTMLSTFVSFYGILRNILKITESHDKSYYYGSKINKLNKDTTGNLTSTYKFHNDTHWYDNPIYGMLFSFNASRALDIATKTTQVLHGTPSEMIYIGLVLRGVGIGCESIPNLSPIYRDHDGAKISAVDLVERILYPAIVLIHNLQTPTPTNIVELLKYSSPALSLASTYFSFEASGYQTRYEALLMKLHESKATNEMPLINLNEGDGILIPSTCHYTDSEYLNITRDDSMLAGTCELSLL